MSNVGKSNLTHEEIGRNLHSEMPKFSSGHGHENKSSNFYSFIGKKKYRHSAVLIPLIYKDNETKIILTVRSKSLPTHAGQISFPGGKVDQSDGDALETATREAGEEIGLRIEDLTIHGFLDICKTGTNYMILPVVGTINRSYIPTLNHREVDRIIYLPLDFIRDKSNLKEKMKIIDGVERYFFVYEYKGYNIWGATAKMLKLLSEKVFDYV
tara:strand:- start:2734 stop:3369 length:636 start_codon:yes stop_codon:yes gene_type:complete